MFYQLKTQASLKNSDSSKLLIKSPLTKRLEALSLLGFVFFFAITLSLFLLYIAYQNPDALIGLVCGFGFLLLALLFALNISLDIHLEGDETHQTLVIIKSYLLGFGPWPRKRRKSFNFAKIAGAVYTPGRGSWGRVDHSVQLNIVDEKPIILTFGNRESEAKQTASRIDGWVNPEFVSYPNNLDPIEGEEQVPAQITENNGVDSNAVKADYASMKKEIRSWGIVLLILGIVHIAGSQFFNSSWGILLIVVGLASLYFRDVAAMFGIYAVTIVWTGLMNLLSGQNTWVGFALIQFFIAFLNFRLFRNFNRIQQEQKALNHAPTSNTEETKFNTAARLFPWLSAILGAFSLVGFIGFYIVIILFFAFSESGDYPAVFEFIGDLMINMGVLAFALGLVSLVSKFKTKIASLIGLGSSLLTLLILIGLILVGRLG